jgi:thiol-disulfide isomerase/thioredoxin
MRFFDSLFGSNMQKISFFAAFLLMVAAIKPTTAPSTQPADPLISQIQDILKQEHKIMPSDALLHDPEQRAKIKGDMVPLLQHMLALENQWMAAHPGQEMLWESNILHLGRYLVLGGKPADVQAPAENVAPARMVAEFIVSDSKRQQEIVDADNQELIRKCQADPNDLRGLVYLNALRFVTGATTPEIEKTILDDVLQGMSAIGKARQIAQAKIKYKDVLNHPMVLAGTEPSGQAFTTADWKGKVILVDFWATWCGPCKAELPRIKGLYKKYHAQGLEVLGVSNDIDKDSLIKFVARDPDMPWPQLFDQKAADDGKWNSLTAKYEINAIPTMFLIDRNGVCRSVLARSELEELIPALLSEKPTNAVSSSDAAGNP